MNPRDDSRDGVVGRIGLPWLTTLNNIVLDAQIRDDAVNPELFRQLEELVEIIEAEATGLRVGTDQ